MQIQFASLGLVAAVLLSVVDASFLAPKSNNGASDVVSPNYRSFSRRRFVRSGSNNGNKGLQIGDKSVDSIYRRSQDIDEAAGEAPEGDKEESLEEVKEEELERRSFIYRRSQDVDEAAGEAPEGDKEESLEEIEEEELERRSFIYRRSQDVDEAAGEAPEGDKEEGLEEEVEDVEN